MEKIFNVLSEKDQSPRRLDFLKILKWRSPELFAEQRKLYNSLYTGEKGEQEVIHLFQMLGRKHWRYIRNYWGNLNGSFESDLIVFTGNSCYNLELKNYKGLFEYKDGISKMNGRESNTDCVFQARRSFKNIRKMLSPFISFKNVKGALIFVGVDNEMKAVRTGIVCIECASFNVDITRKFVKCRQCAHNELREQAIVRTIHEYGVLRYDEPLQRKDLTAFLGGQASTRYLTNLLSVHFERINNGKYTCYKNNHWF